MTMSQTLRILELQGKPSLPPYLRRMEALTGRGLASVLGTRQLGNGWEKFLHAL